MNLYDKLLNKSDRYLKLCLALSGDIIAYHVGPKLVGNAFDLKYIGSGENNMILGPGVYFLTSEKEVKVYAKYHKRPYIYKVSIKADGLYDPIKGEPKHLRERMFGLRKKVMNELGISEREFEKGSPLTHGNAGIGDFVFHLGAEKTRELFSKIGVTGIYEEIGPKVFEIAVYDLSTVTMLEKIPLGDEAKYEEEERQDKIKAATCFFCGEQMYDPFANLSREERSKLLNEHEEKCRERF